MTVLIQNKGGSAQVRFEINDRDEILQIKRELLSCDEIASYPKRQLYVHVPFCFFHCSFCVYRGDLLQGGRGTRDFVSDLEAEIVELGPVAGSFPFHSAFVGGGTVTTLSADQIAAMLFVIRRNFAFVEPHAEFTVELAPHGLKPAKIDVLRQFDVNRVSIGIQSVDDQLLLGVNRPPIPKRTLSGLLRRVHEAEFDEVNVDLMVGIVGRTFENLLSDFEQLALWGCRSIMVYIDMTIFRDPDRAEEAKRQRGMVEQLATAVSGDFVLNGENGVNEYNRFIARDYASASPFASRYSTEHTDPDLFCLGLGRKAQSWNREFIMSWQ